MQKFEEFYEAIDEIRALLKKDLIGPVEKDEVLEDIEPLSTYASGILYARKISDIEDNEEQSDEADSNNDVQIEDLLGVDDDSIKTANKYKPTSMGFTFSVSENETKIKARFSFGVYKYQENQDPKQDEARRSFTRHQHEINWEIVIPDKPQIIHRSFKHEDYDLEIYLTFRAVTNNNNKLLTLTVANNMIGVNKLGLRSEFALFQCELDASCESGFAPIYKVDAKAYDIEQQITRLLYKSVKNYACGHGCSVSYNEEEDGVFSISSDFIPTEQLLQMMPGEISNKAILSLEIWSNIERDKACNMLMEFIKQYEMWKNEKALGISEADEFYHAEQEIIKRIELCIKRLKASVLVLRSNDIAWTSFKLMNEAMYLQRIKTKRLKEGSHAEWYPFQLAYIMQIIPDIVDPNGEFRKTVDLLWFPTGGGKTEAYFGVAAFNIFFRRISQRTKSDGVTVIMRYTLRLLTIQQFERASALICACEILRRKYNIPGGEINIGLWIGTGMTPNTIKDAKDALEKLHNNKDNSLKEKNPIQITKCPWCNCAIDVTGYSIKDNNLVIRCNDNPDCDFHNGLPIYVVDEDIYEKRPTLLLSTIDKFARIVWEPDSKNLFGNGFEPPSLIIQDELHLISGALGSLAGAYETAVEYMCLQNGSAPKVIASTATVKNAPEQVKKLYNRDTFQFPPNGISYDDSFFAHIASKYERPARTYIGLCEPGNSITDLFVRTYVALSYCKIALQKENRSKDVIDQYYTIVGYFNAIRDLGSSANILQSRMITHLRALIERKFKKLSEKLGIDKKTDLSSLRSDELTSRKKSSEIKSTLEMLETPYTEYGCYSYILASNMLSVGIDIDRLGLMTVYNQPKSNAEYIQATSRVGRSNPGLVLALYNPMRTRDRSHYEQFGFYHRTFYQYVESTSVTPFSIGALEKALHGVFVAMVRHTVPGMSSNNAAGYFKNGPEIQKISEFILTRVRETMPENVDYVEDILNDIIDIWENMSSTYSDLTYTSSGSGGVYLLRSAEMGYDCEFPPVLNSLRNVERAANIYLEV